METAIRAILFDMDGTLLDNDMDVFLPHYFRLLTAHVAHILPPEPFMAHLMQATQKMLDNDGRASNEKVFSAAFYPLAGHARQEIEPLFLDFYENVYPSLQQYTRPVAGARRVVQLAFELGCQVVVATNPLFPATATLQRLAWAGVDDFAYRRITSYENSCAVKPNLLYFEQILDFLGLPPEAGLVVGDENMDMVAAHLGCRTFLVPGSRTDLAPDTPQPTYKGSLADLEALLRRWQIKSP